jgi:hypothetical protein
MLTVLDVEAPAEYIDTGGGGGGQGVGSGGSGGKPYRSNHMSPLMSGDSPDSTDVEAEDHEGYTGMYFLLRYLQVLHRSLDHRLGSTNPLSLRL